MKIVHLCLASFFIDNYSYQENLLPKYHKYSGFDVTIIASLVSFDNNGKYTLLSHESEYETVEGCKVYRLDYRHPCYAFNRLFRRYHNFYSILKKENPDLIFIHGIQFSDIKTVLRYKMENPAVRLFCDNHADWVNSATNFISKNILHKVIWKYFAKRAEPYIEWFYGVTPSRCDFLKDVYGISPLKIDLLVMGLDDQSVPWKEAVNINKRIRENLDIGLDDFLIISGGKIDERKNIHLLIDAVQRISNKCIHLVIFGNIAPEFKDTIHSLLASDTIHFVGWLTPDQTIEYFLAANLAVFPGTHSVLWEQVVGLGIPAIFKYWMGMTHIDLNGNCILLHNDSVEELEYMIKDLHSCPDKYLKMKAHAVTVSSFFSYTTIAHRSICND